MDCNQIQQEVDELKMKMSACKKLKAEDMLSLLDLITTLDNCKCNCDSESLPLQVYSFQFDSLTDDISNIDLITSDFLDSNGIQHSEVSLTNGKNITLSTVGRYGFVINNTEDNPYQIFDVLNNDVTANSFDTIYDSSTRTFYYVSKEYVIPSNLFYKFVKNN